MTKLLIGVFICSGLLSAANAEIDFDRNINLKEITKAAVLTEVKAPALPSRVVVFESVEQEKSLQQYCPFYQDQNSCTMYNCSWQPKGCYAGPGTPAYAASYCRFSPDMNNCNSLGCDWKPARCKSTEQASAPNNGALQQYCSFYQDQNSCTTYNCKWEPKGCYAGPGTPAYAASYCRFSPDMNNCNTLGCQWKPARCRAY